MANEEELCGVLEWRENKADGTSKKLEPELALVHRVCIGLQGLITRFISKIWRFLGKAWNLGVSEPKKVIHCLKVGLALSLVSLFYYMRPLYDGVGGNAMWAVMTVVVVFEYTVGATLYKTINRAIGTLLAGALGIGVHWVANQCGENFEPVILDVSVFILASATTFSRFIPSFKARFDYGAMIFILTFSLVSVSGYRVDKLFELAHSRVSTIIIGTSICILISCFLCPVWAGTEFHLLINRNLEKLADSLDGCVVEFFNDNVNSRDEDSIKKIQGYKCALNSKATEESMANFARWEPAHGSFNFRHPWKQYLQIGAALRSTACCVESLNSCIDSEIQVPKFLKKDFSDVCMRLSSHCSKVLKELAVTMKTMTKPSSTTDLSVGEMNFAVQELQNALKSFPDQLLSPPSLENNNNDDDDDDDVDENDNEKEGESTTKHSVSMVTTTLIEILPLATAISLLIEIAARVEGIVDAVDDLADSAEFKAATDDEKSQQNQCTTEQIMDDGTMRVLQKV